MLNSCHLGNFVVVKNVKTYGGFSYFFVNLWIIIRVLIFTLKLNNSKCLIRFIQSYDFTASAAVAAGFVILLFSVFLSASRIAWARCTKPAMTLIRRHRVP